MVTGFEVVVSTSSESILLEAEQLWTDSRRAHRDVIIRVGALIAKFILARLQEGDGLPEANRIKKGITREVIMDVVASRLRVHLRQDYDMVRVAKVVELLGDPGNLSHSTLRVFTVFVQRRVCKVTRIKNPKPDEVLPSKSEVWEVKPHSGVDPRELYKQAVEQNWDSAHARHMANTRIKVDRRGGAGPKPKSSYKSYTSSVQVREDRESVNKPKGDHFPTLIRLGQQSDPKDLVDMVIVMIEACPRRDELKRLLLEVIK